MMTGSEVMEGKQVSMRTRESGRKRYGVVEKIYPRGRRTSQMHCSRHGIANEIVGSASSEKVLRKGTNAIQL